MVLVQLELHMQNSTGILSHIPKLACQLWQYAPAILVPGRLRQENWGFKSSLGYMAKLCLQNKLTQIDISVKHKTTKAFGGKWPWIRQRGFRYDTESHNKKKLVKLDFIKKFETLITTKDPYLRIWRTTKLNENEARLFLKKMSKIFQ